nr:hypothetical protein CFP56_52916 [Quercus suber]
MADQAITSTYYKGMSIMGLQEIKLGVLGRIIIFFVMQCVELFETIIMWAEPDEEEVMDLWWVGVGVVEMDGNESWV